MPCFESMKATMKGNGFLKKANDKSMTLVMHETREDSLLITMLLLLSRNLPTPALYQAVCFLMMVVMTTMTAINVC